SRRRFLGACAGALAVGVTGCQTAPDGDDGDGGASGPTEGADGSAGLGGGTGNEAGTPDAAGGDDPNVDRLSQSMSEPYARVYRNTVSSVAQIRVYTPSGGGQGTGWLYDDGHLVTNEHVVAGASEVYVRFHEGGWIPASVVGTDVYSDLAVLSVDEAPASATPLDTLRTDPPIGTEVVAIGNPFGLSGSVSAGIVSGLDRTLRAANNFSIPDAIQTDAPVNPGNSGGPLVDLNGDVVGVINSGGGDNIAFAISAPLVRRVVPELLADGDYDHPYMGVRIENVGPLLARANDVERGTGVYVHEVRRGTPAAGVLQGSEGSESIEGRQVYTGGDVIVAMDGTAIGSQQALASFLALETRPGDTIDVTVLRDGAETTVQLTLGSRPEP
ncbi:MAG: S1C family serine protease, partial [Haloarculaceae archaeon]